MSYWGENKVAEDIRWSPEEDALLKKVWPQGKQAAVMAFKAAGYNRTLEALKSRAGHKHYGVKRVPMSKEERRARKREWERKHRRLRGGESLWKVEENKVMSKLAEYRKLIPGWV